MSRWQGSSQLTVHRAAVMSKLHAALAHSVSARAGWVLHAGPREQTYCCSPLSARLARRVHGTNCPPAALSCSVLLHAACLTLPAAAVCLLRLFAPSLRPTDPSHAEMTSGGPELTVAILPRSGKVTLTTMDARLPLDQFEGMLTAARKGCKQVHELLNSAALEYAAVTLRKRRGMGMGRTAAGAAAAAAEGAEAADGADADAGAGGELGDDAGAALGLDGPDAGAGGVLVSLLAGAGAGAGSAAAAAGEAADEDEAAGAGGMVDAGFER